MARSPAQEAGAGAAADDVAERLWQAQKLLVGDAAARARAHAEFEAIVGTGGPWYAPAARIGLAACERADSAPWRALAHLRSAAEAIATLDPAVELVVAMQRWLHEESVRSHLALGLLDLAQVAWERLEALGPAPEPADRMAAGLVGIDLALAQGRWQDAKVRAQHALDDPALASVPGFAPQVRLRLLVAGRRGGAGEGHAALAEDLLAVEADLPGSQRAAARLEAAAALLEVGDLARVLEVLADPGREAGLGLVQAAQREALRGRALLQLGAERAELAAARARLLAAAEAWWGSLAGSPLRSGGVGSLQFDERRDFVATLVALDRAVDPGEEGVASAFEHVERTASLGTTARRLSASASSLADAQRWLVPTGGGMLAFWIAPVAGSVFVVERGFSFHHEFVVDAGLLADFALLRSALAGTTERVPSATAALREAGNRIWSRILPAEVRPRVLAWSGVLLVGDEELADVWQTLPHGDSWWCVARRLEHLPSAALGLALARRSASAKASPRPPRVSVFADPGFPAELGSRYGVARLALAQPVRERLTGGRRPRTVFWDLAAAVDAMSGDAGKADLWAILTHGVHDYERERSALLLMAPSRSSDGCVGSDTIERLSVPPVVVVGACSAGEGPTRVGDDGVGHLGGAFLTAGAATILVADAPLPLGATVELVARFLDAWQDGQSIAEALRVARAAVAAMPNRGHPYYFAGLRQIGVDPAAVTRR